MKRLIVLVILVFAACIAFAQAPADTAPPEAPADTPSETPAAPEEPLKPEDMKVILFNAVMDGDLTHVQQLMNKKAPVNITDSSGFSPLHYSVCFKDLAITKLLINNKANLDARDIEGYTPIYYAAENGSAEIFNLLLKRGASTAPTEKTSLLHMAAYGGNTDIIRALLDKQLSPTARDSQELLPIDYAAARNNDDAVLLLADHMPEEAISLNTLLPLLVGENKKVLHGLFAKVADKDRFNSELDSPARIVAHYSTADMLSFLEEEGVSVTWVSPSGNSALFEAALAGNMEVLKLLIDKGMDVNCVLTDTGFTPIMTACCAGNSDIVKYLAEKGARLDMPSAKGTYLIHEAAFRGNLELVIFFTDRQQDVNMPDSRGVTPLFHALDANQPGVVSWLLEHGADPRHKTMNGDTALHYAALADNEALFKQIIPLTAGYANLQDKDGVTPLMYAAMTGNMPVVRALLALGAKPDARDAEGNTLLHFAVLSNKPESVRLLLEKGVNPDTPNSRGELPLDIAEKNKYGDVIAVLKPAPPEQEAAPDTPEGDSPAAEAPLPAEAPAAPGQTAEPAAPSETAPPKS
ncbi:MAG: ankyrin repeat domain-containing protein [Abditibacteriota bacterium]|nr:ankyrin repeat domain-containing protein [Abditibacteriota bacterium]